MIRVTNLDSVKEEVIVEDTFKTINNISLEYVKVIRENEVEIIGYYVTKNNEFAGYMLII